MEPVRTVQDIVRRKIFAKPNRDGFITRNIKNAATAVLRSPSARIPFLIWFALMLVESVFVIKSAAEIIPRPSAPQLSADGTKPNATMTLPEGLAMVQNVVTPPEPISAFPTSSATSSNATSTIAPEIKPAGVSSTTSRALPPKATSTKATSTAASSKKPAVQPSKPKPAQIPTPVPTTVTAKSLIDATTLSTIERRDGPYKIILATKVGNDTIPWDLSKTDLTISGASIPSFSISYSCNPAPNTPDFDALDQSPMFNVQTTYTCTIGLTPNSGNNRQTQSKQFSFTTGAGQLFVTSQSSMSTILKSNLNTGGFIFRNDDTDPVTVTGIDVDVSYRGLDTMDGPLLLRVKDTATDLPLAEYNLENLAADPSASYAHSGTNIHIPFSFTINAASQKLLRINVLGVHRLSIYGVDPTVSITLHRVTTDKNADKVVLSAAKISWSCIVPIGAYDPNATSGPFATGQACQQ